MTRRGRWALGVLVLCALAVLSPACLFEKVFSPGQPDDLGVSPDGSAGDLAGRDLAGADASQVDLASVACTTSAQCVSKTEPICRSNGRCGPCGADMECAALGVGRSRCELGTGACVECLATSDCASTVAKPACDASEHVCRVCQRHVECASGACDAATGQCVTASNIYYVDNRNRLLVQCNNDFVVQDGSLTNPFCSIQEAINEGGRRYIVVAGRPLFAYGAITVSSGDDVVVVGPGQPSPALIDSASGTLVEVTSGGRLVLEGVDVGNVLNSHPDGSMRCQDSGSRMTVRDSRVMNGFGGEGGIYSDGCDLVVDAVTVAGHAKRGLRLKNGTYSVSNTVVRDNDEQGVLIESATGTFVFNTVLRNGDLLAPSNEGGIECGSSQTIGSSIVLFNESKNTRQIRSCTLTQVVVGLFDTSVGGTNALPTFSNLIDGRLLAGDATNHACCVDKVTGPDLADHDIDLERRPKGLSHDIGADEVE